MSNCPAFTSWITHVPLRDRVPNNHPVRDFHEPTDISLGFPDLFPHEPLVDWDLVDPRRNASWLPHDLALCYAYDTMEEFLIEGELMSFPVVRYVYRRDRDLRWSEIRNYLRDGSIPFRYPPRNPPGASWINEPMNADNFKKIAKRFLRVEHGYRIDLYERSSGLPVQQNPLDFEERFVYGPCAQFPAELLASSHPRAILVLFRFTGHEAWYLNGVRRARIASLYMRLCILTGRPFTIEGFFFFAANR
jgi:hypothetical protein